MAMGSQGNPQTWVPFDNIKDCSQGFCSLYCPQWCYFILPPPPPYGFNEDDSKTNFSPLVIAIIGTLASAFLLVSYYTVISKYCGSIDSLIRRGRRSNNLSEESNENNPNLSNNEAWQASEPGLDEALIKSITVCEYKKGDGFVEGTDCSVCLSEFQEGENLRLLPKCSHAFHLPCIDTWLKSHSNCPLCRANVVSSTSPLPLPVINPVVQESPVDSAATSPENQESSSNNHTAVITVEELGRTSCEAEAISDIATPKSPRRVHDDEEEVEEIRDAIIEIRDEGVLHQPIRRSISMDGSTYREHVSVADILCLSEDEEEDDDDDDSSMENHKFDQVGVESSSKQEQAVVGNDHGKGSSNNSRILHNVMNPTAMKRSFSSGRLLFSRNKRGRNILIPV